MSTWVWKIWFCSCLRYPVFASGMNIVKLSLTVDLSRPSSCYSSIQIRCVFKVHRKVGGTTSNAAWKELQIGQITWKIRYSRYPKTGCSKTRLSEIGTLRRPDFSQKNSLDRIIQYLIMLYTCIKWSRLATSLVLWRSDFRQMGVST